MKQIVIIPLLFILLDCDNSEKKRYLIEVSSMMEEVDSLQAVLKQNKMDSLVEYQISVNALMKRIRTDYKPKDVNLRFGHMVDEFKELQMLFVKEKEENKRTLSGQYILISNSLEEEYKTLNELKSDIENNRGDKQKYDEFLTFENRKINTIKGLLDYYLRRKTKNLPRFHKSMKEINEFLDNYEKIN